jgi:hypothetical protein
MGNFLYEEGRQGVCLRSTFHLVNLNRQVGNGLIISTLTYQYNVHDIAKLYKSAIHFPSNFPFITLKIGPCMVNLFRQVGFIKKISPNYLIY